MVTRFSRALLLALGAVLVLAAGLLVQPASTGQGAKMTPQSDIPAVVAEQPAASPNLGREPLAMPRRRDVLTHETAGEGAEPPRPSGTVFLQVLDDSDRAPVLRFEWACTAQVAGMVPGDSARGGVARIRVPLATPVAVRIQSPGYAPSLPIDVSLQRGAVARTVRIRLVPEPEGSGVRLTIRDPQERPVTRVQIVCESRLPGRGEHNGWRVLWQRESSSANGVHRLALAPAHYRLHLTAIHANRQPLTMLTPQVCRVSVDHGAPVGRTVTMPLATKSLAQRRLNRPR